MIQRHTITDRVASFAHKSKPYLKIAGIWFAFAFLYYFPAVVDIALSAVAYLYGLQTGTFHDVPRTVITDSVITTVWKIAVIGYFGVRFARVHQLVWSRWRELRAATLATLALLILPGLFGLLTTALSGGYSDWTVADGNNGSTTAAVMQEFTSFAGTVEMFLPLVVLTYFYFAFNPDSFADYRDVLVSTTALTVLVTAYSNFLSDVRWRVMYPEDYSWVLEGVVGSTVDSVLGMLFFMLYFVAIFAAFLWGLEYFGGGIEHDQSGDLWT